MEIIRENGTFTDDERYLATINPEIESISKVEDGTVIEVMKSLIFKDIKSNGDVVEILSILTPDYKCYSCQSATFRESFETIAKLKEGKQFSVKKISGVTKAGRPYINCTLVVNL